MSSRDRIKARAGPADSPSRARTVERAATSTSSRPAPTPEPADAPPTQAAATHTRGPDRRQQATRPLFEVRSVGGTPPQSAPGGRARRGLRRSVLAPIVRDDDLDSA
jgi:hypothetical protein